MQFQNKEILIVIFLGAILSLLLLGFVVTIVFLYQKRQQQHRLDILEMEDDYNQQILRVQFDMQEATLAEISNKLHDTVKNNINGVIAGIASIKIKWQKELIDAQKAFEDINEYENLLAEIRDEIRLTSHSLSNDKLEKVGLIDSINFELNRIVKSNQQFTFNIICTNNNLYDFSQEQSIYLYRIFQEIINNSINHSSAKNINVAAKVDEKGIFLLQIKDDGKGFDVNEKLNSKLSGIGLSGIKKRCLQIGASHTIKSDKGIGTLIEITIPLSLKSNITLNKNEQQKTMYSFD